jgi:hypothetical protein
MSLIIYPCRQLRQPLEWVLLLGSLMRCNHTFARDLDAVGSCFFILLRVRIRTKAMSVLGDRAQNAKCMEQRKTETCTF